MKAILRIAKAELQSLFYSPIAWILLILFTFQATTGLFRIMEMLVRTQDLGGVESSITFKVFGYQIGLFKMIQNTLFIYVPLLTMGIVSREYTSGSIKLLYSSPITNFQIIFGKFLAMMVYGFCLIIILIILSIFATTKIENPDIPLILTGLLGLYLLVCSYMAIGIYLSSLTNYQIVAALGTFAVLLLLNMTSSLWQDVAFVRDITYWLAIGGRANEFVDGLICSEDIIYFLTIIALFIGLTVIRLQAKRQKLPFSITWGKYVSLFVGAMLIGYITSRPALMTFHDSTATKFRTLTPNSQDIVSKVEGGLTMTTYVNIFNRDYMYLPARGINTDIRRYRMYSRFKPEIKFKHHFYYDDPTGEAYSFKYPDLNTREKMEKLAETYRVSPKKFMEPEKIRAMIDLEPEEYRIVKLVERANGQKTFLRTFDDNTFHPSEAEITAALKRLVMDLPKVGFVTGHRGRDMNNSGDRGYYTFSTQKSYRHSLINNGFDVEEISLKNRVPEDINIIVLSDARTLLDEIEEANLDQYIVRGGNLLIAGEVGRQDVMNPIVEKFGVKFMPGQLVKANSNQTADLITSNVTPEGARFSYHLAGIYGRYVITMPGCLHMEYENKGFDVVEILKSDAENCWNELETTDFVDDTVRLNPAIGEVEKAYPTALALSRNINGREQKIIILADADCLSNTELSRGRTGIRSYNYALINASFFWLSDEEVPVDVRRPATPDRNINLIIKTMVRWKNAIMIIIPGLLLITFLIIWIRRRGR